MGRRKGSKNKPKSENKVTTTNLTIKSNETIVPVNFDSSFLIPFSEDTITENVINQPKNKNILGDEWINDHYLPTIKEFVRKEPIKKIAYFNEFTFIKKFFSNFVEHITEETNKDVDILLKVLNLFLKLKS